MMINLFDWRQSSSQKEYPRNMMHSSTLEAKCMTGNASVETYLDIGIMTLFLF